MDPDAGRTCTRGGTNARPLIAAGSSPACGAAVHTPAFPHEPPSDRLSAEHPPRQYRNIDRYSVVICPSYRQALSATLSFRARSATGEALQRGSPGDQARGGGIPCAPALDFRGNPARTARRSGGLRRRRGRARRHGRCEYARRHGRHWHARRHERRGYARHHGNRDRRPDTYAVPRAGRRRPCALDPRPGAEDRSRHLLARGVRDPHGRRAGVHPRRARRTACGSCSPGAS